MDDILHPWKEYESRWVKIHFPWILWWFEFRISRSAVANVIGLHQEWKCTGMCDSIDASALLKLLGKRTRGVKVLLSEVLKLVLIVITQISLISWKNIQCSAIKSGYRCTITQVRLMQLLLLYAYKEETMALNTSSILTDFVSRTPERKVTFGNGLWSLIRDFTALFSVDILHV